MDNINRKKRLYAKHRPSSRHLFTFLKEQHISRQILASDNSDVEAKVDEGSDISGSERRFTVAGTTTILYLMAKTSVEGF